MYINEPKKSLTEHQKDTQHIGRTTQLNLNIALKQFNFFIYNYNSDIQIIDFTKSKCAWEFSYKGVLKKKDEYDVKSLIVRFMVEFSYQPTKDNINEFYHMLRLYCLT
jgi:hypothetical protein